MRFYNFASVTMISLARGVARVQVRGIENVPKDGPAIIAANHINFTDPPLLGGALPREIIFMAKDELFHHPFFGPIVRHYGAFPVRRGNHDLAAYRTALKYLNAGAVIGMFPEGHRSPDGRLQPFHPGVITLAMRSGAPIVPVAIEGTELWVRWPEIVQRPLIKITVGPALSVPNGGRSQVADYNNILMGRIAALLPAWRHVDDRPSTEAVPDRAI